MSSTSNFFILKYLTCEKCDACSRDMEDSYMNDTVDNIELPVRPPVSAG